MSENAFVSNVEAVINGNREGITLLMHRSMPFCAAEMAVALSRIKINIAMDERIMEHIRFWANVLTSEDSMLPEG